jgi:uncharacterized protein YcsI (UPF0317 family)
MAFATGTHPRDVRALIRRGQLRGPTAGLAHGYAQANLVVLPADLAADFSAFCARNPKPCPVLEVTGAGVAKPVRLARDADLRTDLPRYRIYRQGRLEASVDQILTYWRKDLVAFLLGCSFTFESALLAAGVPVRHLEQRANVPMYVTNVDCVPSGPFRGPLVVSMRPIPRRLVPRAVQVTGRYPAVHGAPVQLGDPAALGIGDLSCPDFGDPVTVLPGEVPVFWACGVTSQAVALESKPELMISHEPGHMFLTDLTNEELASA